MSLHSDQQAEPHMFSPQVMSGRSLIIHADGLCEPRNPGGYACWAWVVTEGNPRAQDYGCVAKGPRATNNLAEYTAVGKALRWCADEGIKGAIIRTDSKLVVMQVNGEWACNATHLQPLMKRARALMEATGAVLDWVPREQNQAADELSRTAYREARHVLTSYSTAI